MRIDRILLAVFAALFGLLSTPKDAPAQFCPPGSQQVQSGYAIMCQCPDGSFAGIQGCPMAAPQQQPVVGDVCSGGDICPVGTRCSWQPGRCVPLGKVDCGNYSCEPGAKCSSGGCIADTANDCGNGTHCDSGRCSRNGRMCLTGDQVDCGNHSCASGLKCSSKDSCIPKDYVDCGGGHSCAPGLKCGSGNQCLLQSAVDCGHGQSCPAGNVCVKGGAECVTTDALSSRAAAEKQAAQEKAALEKRLKLLPTQQKKEDAEATNWLKKEQTRLAKDAEIRKAATAQAAQQLHMAQSMSPSQFDQKWCPSATLMTYGAFSSSEITNQRRVCATQNLSEMPAIKRNCVRAEMMAGCGCHKVGQVQAEAAALGCSGYSTASLTLLPSIAPPPGSSSP